MGVLIDKESCADKSAQKVGQRNIVLLDVKNISYTLFLFWRQ